MGIVVDGELMWYYITCCYFLKVISLFRSIIFSSLFLGLSAQANQICPKGYTDGNNTSLRRKYYITYNGTKHDCVESMDTGYNYECGNVGYVNNIMRASIRSTGGVAYDFTGPNPEYDKNPNDFKRIDCSSGSFCLVRTLSNNLATPSEKQINFNVLISLYSINQVECNKLSF